MTYEGAWPTQHCLKNSSTADDPIMVQKEVIRAGVLTTGHATGPHRMMFLALSAAASRYDANTAGRRAVRRRPTTTGLVQAKTTE